MAKRSAFCVAAFQRPTGTITIGGCGVCGIRAPLAFFSTIPFTDISFSR